MTRGFVLREMGLEVGVGRSRGEVRGVELDVSGVKLLGFFGAEMGEVFKG